MIGAAQAEEVRISGSDCRMLEAYEAGEADYQPGVAANGDTVAPADLNPQSDIGSTIVIDLKLDVLEQLGISASSPLLDPEAHLGIIAVQGDQVYFNGQKLGDAETRYLSAQCRDPRSDD